MKRLTKHALVFSSLFAAISLWGCAPDGPEAPVGDLSAESAEALGAIEDDRGFDCREVCTDAVLEAVRTCHDADDRGDCRDAAHEAAGICVEARCDRPDEDRPDEDRPDERPEPEANVCLERCGDLGHQTFEACVEEHGRESVERCREHAGTTARECAEARCEAPERPEPEANVCLERCGDLGHRTFEACVEEHGRESVERCREHAGTTARECAEEYCEAPEAPERPEPEANVCLERCGDLGHRTFEACVEEHGRESAERCREHAGTTARECAEANCEAPEREPAPER